MLVVAKVRCRIWVVPVRIRVVAKVRCRKIWQGACARREKVSARSPHSAFVST